MKRRYVILGGALLLAALGPALSSPQPDNVCGACGSPFEEAADEKGLAASVTNSTATIHVHANGSATWIVTNRVNASAADRLHENPALLDRIANHAATSGGGLPSFYDEGEVQVTAAAIEDRTVTIKFVDSNAGHRLGGVMVVDYLHSEGVRGGWILNADRFTIVGPPGTTVVNNPSAAIDREYMSANAVPIVDGRRVTWHGSAETKYEAAFYDDIYLAFGDAGIPAWRVDVALALATAPIWVDNLRTFVLPAVIVYGILLLGVAFAVRWIATTDVDPGRLAIGVTALGAIGVVAAMFAPTVNQPRWFAGIAAVYLVTGTAALARPDAFRSTRGAIGVGAVSLVAIMGVLGALSVAGGGGFGFGFIDGSVGSVLQEAIYHLPLVVAPAFGVALARASRRGSRQTSLGAFLGALASLAVAGAVFVPFASRPFGLVIIFTVGGSVLAAFFGLPLAALSARRWTSDRSSADEGNDHATATD